MPDADDADISASREAVAVLVPLISANEPEAQVVSVDVDEGQAIGAGDLIAVVENTKSAVDVEAEAGGYVVGLNIAEDDHVRAGDLLCWIAPSADWEPPVPADAASTGEASGGGGTSADVPAGVRITEPALARARALALDLTSLPVGPLVTTALVESLARDRAPMPRWITEPPSPAAVEDDTVLVLGAGPRRTLPSALAVYGAGGHGAQCVDLLRALDLPVEGFLDDGRPAGTSIDQGAADALTVLGGGADLASIAADGVTLAVNAVGGIAAPDGRARVFDSLREAGFTLPALVHPSAWFEASAGIAAGAQVFAHAYVGSRAAIGAGAIVNTGAIVSHDCVLGPCANLSPGAILAGGVTVGALALVGMGVTVNLGVRIGAGARIGNGATVKGDLPDGGVVRAGESWPR